jgi:hypothetical protein
LAIGCRLGCGGDGGGEFISTANGKYAQQRGTTSEQYSTEHRVGRARTFVQRLLRARIVVKVVFVLHALRERQRIQVCQPAAKKSVMILLR